LIHPSAGFLNFIIDNNPAVSLTGLNTQALGDDLLTHVQLMSSQVSGSGVGIHTLFDDIVIEDDNSVHLPECRIQQLRPNADGSTLDLVPSTGVNHYAVVDEAQVSTTDYLSGTSVGDLDLLGVEDLSVIPGTILGLKAVGFGAKTDAASRSWNLGIESGGTVVNGSDLSLTTDPSYYEHDLETDPDTGVEWTQSGVNAAQLQPRVAV
jgi:hypothetical protein